jgi:hypothetical protein
MDIPNVRVTEYPGVTRNPYETAYSPAAPATRPMSVAPISDFRAPPSIKTVTTGPELVPGIQPPSYDPLSSIRAPAPAPAPAAPAKAWTWEDIPGVKTLEKQYRKHVAPKVEEITRKVETGFQHPELVRFLAGLSGGPSPNPDWGPPGMPIRLPPGLVSKSRKRSKEDEEQTAEDMKKVGKHDRNRRQRRLQPVVGLI